MSHECKGRWASIFGNIVYLRSSLDWLLFAANQSVLVLGLQLVDLRLQQCHIDETQLFDKCHLCGRLPLGWWLSGALMESQWMSAGWRCLCISKVGRFLIVMLREKFHSWAKPGLTRGIAWPCPHSKTCSLPKPTLLTHAQFHSCLSGNRLLLEHIHSSSKYL